MKSLCIDIPVETLNNPYILSLVVGGYITVTWLMINLERQHSVCKILIRYKMNLLILIASHSEAESKGRKDLTRN